MCRMAAFRCRGIPRSGFNCCPLRTTTRPRRRNCSRRKNCSRTRNCSRRTRTIRRRTTSGRGANPRDANRPGPRTNRPARWRPRPPTNWCRRCRCRCRCHCRRPGPRRSNPCDVCAAAGGGRCRGSAGRPSPPSARSPPRRSPRTPRTRHPQRRRGPCSHHPFPWTVTRISVAPAATAAASPAGGATAARRTATARRTPGRSARVGVPGRSGPVGPPTVPGPAAPARRAPDRPVSAPARGHQTDDDQYNHCRQDEHEGHDSPSFRSPEAAPVRAPLLA